MFRYTKRMIAEIRFRWNEFKIQWQEDDKIDEVSFNSKHGGIQGFFLYKQFEKERAERKRLHEEQLAAIS